MPAGVQEAPPCSIRRSKSLMPNSSWHSRQRTVGDRSFVFCRLNYPGISEWRPGWKIRWLKYLNADRYRHQFSTVGSGLLTDGFRQRILWSLVPKGHKTIPGPPDFGLQKEGRNFGRPPGKTFQPEWSCPSGGPPTARQWAVFPRPVQSAESKKVFLSWQPYFTSSRLNIKYIFFIARARYSLNGGEKLIPEPQKGGAGHGARPGMAGRG